MNPPSPSLLALSLPSSISLPSLPSSPPTHTPDHFEAHRPTLPDGLYLHSSREDQLALLSPALCVSHTGWGRRFALFADSSITQDDELHRHETLPTLYTTSTHLVCPASFAHCARSTRPSRSSLLFYYWSLPLYHCSFTLWLLLSPWGTTLKQTAYF